MTDEDDGPRPRHYSPEQFAERMRACDNDGHEEQGHIDADMLMCELLLALGYDEGVRVFLNMTRWYA